MKSVLVAAMMVIFSFGISHAGENPKLLKEIKRKAFLDLSKIKLEKNKEEFVIVKFRISNQQIEVLDIDGSREELTEMMIKKLEEMVIQSDAMCDTTYKYKFNFAKE
jgi:hypothetical protein